MNYETEMYNIMIKKDFITKNGVPLALIGDKSTIGKEAPNFMAVRQDLSAFDFYKDTNNGLKIISVVPSLDTGVCELQTKRFNEEAAALSGKVEIITISVDLPFAQKRFCGAEGISNIQVVSDHRLLDFGMKYGFVIEELRLLTRGIIVVDSNNIIRYVEYVKELSTHPDYEKAIAAVKLLL